MCGIYLRNFTNDQKNLDNQTKIDEISELAIKSSRRGSDSSGIYLLFQNPTTNEIKSYLFRIPDSPDILFKSKILKKIINSETLNGAELIVAFGHTRMNTDGSSYRQGNNQPLIEDGKLVVFNGIIVNAEDFGVEPQENDGFAIIRNIHNERDLFFKNAEGMINYIFFDNKEMIFKFFSNNGSLFLDDEKTPSIITSEPTFASKHLKCITLNNELTLKLSGLSFKNELEIFDLESKNKPVVVSNVGINNSSEKDVEELFYEHKIKVDNLNRCKACILPSTHPFIDFDSDGICNFCRNHSPIHLKEFKNFEDYINNARSGNLLLGFSGGRDSSLALHHLVNDFDIKPITYTYDWGVNTNIARRNVSRMCGSLGVENILISADIRKKRRNVKKNLLAWLKNPHPGIIPLLMAGDKQFISNAFLLKKERNIDHEIFAFNLHEKTQFKEEFTGVRMWSDGSSEKYGEDLGLFQQLQMIMFYVGQGIINPRLINSSLFDTAKGFFNYYHSNVNVIQFFEYNHWDENDLNKILSSKYDWEFATDTPTSWRIGDGTASLYNLAYYLLAGFTENDVLRSNLIRENKISRTEALERTQEENLPRYSTLEWYTDILEIEFKPFLREVFKQCLKKSLIN